MNSRINQLRQYAREGAQAEYRVVLPEEWDVSGLDASLCERKALALRLVAEKMPVFILPGELLVGSKTVYGPCVHPEKPVSKHNLNAMCFPHYAKPEEKALFFGNEGAAKNHVLPAYRMPLSLGLDGMRERIAAREADASLTRAQREYLRASRTVLDAVTLLARRYADLARETAVAEADSARKAELAQIERVCEKIGRAAPETLWEAMQLYLFVYFTLLIEQGLSVGFGRIDQLFLPYTGNALSDEDLELIDCFLIKLNDLSDVFMGDLNYNGSDSMILGGTRPDGEDATNGLSFAFLRAFGKLKLSGPMPCVRVSATTPDALIQETCRLNVNGSNSAAFFNDDTFINALIGKGFPPEDARNWGLDLCQDLQIEGQSDFFMAGNLSLYRPIEEVLRSVPDGTPWNDFYARVLAKAKRGFAEMLEFYAKTEAVARALPENPEVCGPALDKLRREAHAGIAFFWLLPPISPLPAISTFMEGCLENARDLIFSGARYPHKGTFLLEPTSAVNSLNAIYSTVYEKGELTLSQIVKAIDANFEGMEDIRLKLLNAPKWGNDLQAYDARAVAYIHEVEKEINRHALNTGEPFLSGVHQPHTQAAGKNLGATPDGRFARAPIPVTLSATNGTDTCGPTASLNSFAKLDPALQQWNAAFTIAFEACREEEKEEKAALLAQMIRAYFDLGGTQIQPNVLNADDLIDAQIHPENHRDLLVRVWGVSMFFIELTKPWQDEIIQRTLNRL